MYSNILDNVFNCIYCSIQISFDLHDIIGPSLQKYYQINVLKTYLTNILVPFTLPYKRYIPYISLEHHKIFGHSLQSLSN